jgi:hypothetical protein
MPFVSPEPVENNVKITLYFGNADATGLVQERREVIRRNEPLEALVLRELIRGPQIAEAQRTIPAETRIISVTVVDRVAYANFTKELSSRHPGGTAGEQMTIYSIVYSLTELPGIERVQLLVEGEKREAIFGHVGTIEPLGRATHQPGLLGVSEHIDLAPSWRGRSNNLVGPVTAVASGNVVGASNDIIVAAGNEVYVFSYSSFLRGYELSARMVFDRFVSSVAAADLNGDGGDEVVIVGAASGNWNHNVPGFITVLGWSDGTLIKLADVSKDNMPFWSVTSMDVTGNGRPEILASNGNALYVFSWQGEEDLQQIHILSRFAGTVYASGDLLAWRDVNGLVMGLFRWTNDKWQTVWLYKGLSEWAEGIPSLGDLTGDGFPETTILTLDGTVVVMSHEGERLDLLVELDEVVTNGGPITSPMFTPTGSLIFGQGAQAVEWKR